MTRMFNRLALTTTALLAPVALVSVPAMAQTIAMTQNSDSPLLSFAVSQEVRAKPDQAGLGAGVQTTAFSATEAMRLNATAMDRVIKAIKAHGVKDEDIQTSGINLSPQYDYSPQQQGLPPKFIGYQVSNQVNVTTRDIGGIGKLLDAMVSAGGTNINGPYFSVRDLDAMLEGARAKALAKAAAKAADYARLTGYRSARLVSLSEGGFSGPQPVQYGGRGDVMLASAKAEAAPVEPGQVSNSLTLNVQYRLEK